MLTSSVLSKRAARKFVEQWTFRRGVNLDAPQSGHGGLFDGASESEIPPLTEEIAKLLDGSSGFDWSGISPTIFGALFESTLNPETRRSGGMHYTSIENIHKLIDPLFLDDLTRRVDSA